MGAIFPGVPRYLAQLAARGLGIKTFVETGTYMGTTAKWAKQHFDRVITIEAAQAIFDRYGAQLQTQGIDARFGRSEDLLAGIADQLAGPALFWLDGHWSCGQTFQGNECPVLQELDAILPASREHLILVDDARHFLAPPPPPLDERRWPSIFDIEKHAKKLAPESWVGVIDDVTVIAPGHLKASILAAYHRDVEAREQTLKTRIYRSPLGDLARTLRERYLASKSS